MIMEIALKALPESECEVELPIKVFDNAILPLAQ